MAFDGYDDSVGAIFPDGKRICINGRTDLFFINVEKMEMEETFTGRDVRWLKLTIRRFYVYGR